jgi:hypothetical protein
LVGYGVVVAVTEVVEVVLMAATVVEVLPTEAGVPVVVMATEVASEVAEAVVAEAVEAKVRASPAASLVTLPGIARWGSMLCSSRLFLLAGR